MSDSLPTVWPAELHTRAKHRILKEYLAAWMPILSNQSRIIGNTVAIKYIDGFAGPGIYEGGEKGSPVLALEVALHHSQAFPVPIELTFIESDKDRFQVLQQQLFLYSEQIAHSSNIRAARPLHGDCRILIDEMLEEAKKQKQKFGPALIFLDQFGYSAVPMDLIGRILSQPQCEVLSYLFWRDMDRFITDQNKHAGITAAFGSAVWQSAIAMPSGQRERFMLNTYMDALKSNAKARYVWPFAMLDESERLLYWLFFCTNHIQGLEEMKRAMWKVDQTGGFSFTDKEGFTQLKFLTTYTDDKLEADMETGLNGKAMTVAAINEWVLTQTPAYKFKTALANLERVDVAEVSNAPKDRKAGSFNDDNLLVRFQRRLFV